LRKPRLYQSCSAEEEEKEEEKEKEEEICLNKSIAHFTKNILHMYNFKARHPRCFFLCLSNNVIKIV
jgi:hypothetical protein